LPITDYNKKKPLEVSSTNDSGTTQDKAQPVVVEGEGTYRTSSISFVDSKDLSGQSSTVTGAAFNNSGSKLYVTEANGTVFEYDLSTNFDVSTAVFNQSLDVSGFAESPEDIIWNDDGTSFYLPDSNDGEVFQYDLSTAFDISTAGPSTPLDVSSETNDPTGISFSNNGEALFVSAGDENVYKYSLGTAYDLSTAVFQLFSDFSSELSDLVDINVNNNGKDLHLLGSVDDKIFEYEFTDPNNITETVFQSSESVSEDSDPQGLLFNDDGLKVYMVGTGSDKIYEYDTGSLDSKTGTGDIIVDFTNIAGPEDIAVYDENGNLLDYEVESLDTSAETGVIWAYDFWVRDDSVQAQIAYGDNSANTDRQNVTATWDNTGQNAVTVQHLQDNPLSATDSTANNNDGTVTGAVSTTGEFDGAASFDGVDDQIFHGQIQDYQSSWTWVVDEKTTTQTDGSLEDIQMTLAARGPSFGGPILSIDQTNGGNFQEDSLTFFVPGVGGNIVDNLSPSPSDGNFHQLVGVYDDASSETRLGFDGSIVNTVSGSSTSSNTDLYFGFNESVTKRNFAGTTSEYRVYSDAKSSDWIQADFDASPKAGQVYFSQQAAEPTVTDQTVTVPETQTTSLNPDPQIDATVDLSIPTSTATTVNPEPTVSPGAAPLNLTASTASTANPDFTVQPGNTTVQTPVSTSTVSNPDPQVNAFNEITVPETSVATVNPAQVLTVARTILTPETTVTSSNPDLTVQPRETNLNILPTQVSATNPEFGLNRQIVVGVATNLRSENPKPNIQPGLVSVEVPETSILTENPALQLQPGVSRLQIERPTNLETVNPDFNTVSGAAELQVSETQLTASVQEPSIGLTLEFVSPTNALITNNERFFDMPDHTFTEGDLGDTLQAVLKTDSSPDGVDLTGATEIKLVVKDRDGVKVFDKEMSIVDSSTGDVEYKWSQGDFIEEPGVYRAKIKVFDSTGEPESFPYDGFRTIEVEEEIS